MHSVAASPLASAWRHSASIAICAHIAARSPSIYVRIAPVRVPSYPMRRSYLYIRLLAYAVFSHAPLPVQRFERVALHLAPPHRGFRAACAFALCISARVRRPGGLGPRRLPHGLVYVLEIQCDALFYVYFVELWTVHGHASELGGIRLRLSFN